MEKQETSAAPAHCGAEASAEEGEEVQVELRVHNTDIADALRGYIERRLKFAAGRFLDQVVRIRVSVSGLKGPRGGTKTSCRISADVKALGRLVVQESDLDAHSAIDHAAARLGRLLTQRMERAEELDRLSKTAA